MVSSERGYNDGHMQMQHGGIRFVPRTEIEYSVLLGSNHNAREGTDKQQLLFLCGVTASSVVARSRVGQAATLVIRHYQICLAMGESESLLFQGYA